MQRINKFVYMFSIIVAILAFSSIETMAQGGGKAEPNQIKFARGSDRATLIGSLSNGQEMDYAFTARGGQTVTITNPTNAIFDVRIFNLENDVETEYDSSRSFSLELPAEGEYLLIVRKKIAGPRRAKFSVTVRIR